MLELRVRHLQPGTWLGIPVVQARGDTKQKHSRGDQGREESADSRKIWEVKLVGLNVGRMQREEQV